MCCIRSTRFHSDHLQVGLPTAVQNWQYQVWGGGGFIQWGGGGVC